MRSSLEKSGQLRILLDIHLFSPQRTSSAVQKNERDPITVLLEIKRDGFARHDRREFVNV